MEKKEIVIESSVAVGEVNILPVAEFSLKYWHRNGSLSFLGFKQPIAVVAVSPSAKRVFRITGEEISLGQFIKEVPDIKEVLERI